MLLQLQDHHTLKAKETVVFISCLSTCFPQLDCPLAENKGII